MAALTQKVEVPAGPGAAPNDANATGNLTAPVNTTTVTLRADPNRQHIAGSTQFWYAGGLRTPPPWKDDLEASFGRELWEKLSFDPVIWSHIQVLRLLILSVDVVLSPAIPQPSEDETDPAILADWEKQQEIVDWSKELLNSLTQPYKFHLYKALDSIYQSYVVSEKTFEEPSAANGYKRRITELMAKPQQVVGFVIDPFLHVIGFVGVQPIMGGFYVMPLFISSDQKTLDNVLPRTKCAVLTYYPDKEDIRGRNPIRAEYEPWWTGFGAWSQLVTGIEQMGGAAVIAECAPDAVPTQRTDPTTGLGLTNEDGSPIIDYPQDAMLRVAQQVAQGVAIAVPNGAKVTPFFVPGALESILQVIEECDKRKGMALLGQTRAQSESEYGSRADSNTGKDLLDQFVAWGRSVCEHYTRSEILKDLITYNWGDDAARMVPVVTMGGNMHEDWAGLATASAKLLAQASPTQANWVWSDVLGGPVMTIEEMEQKRTQPAATDPNADNEESDDEDPEEETDATG